MMKNESLKNALRYALWESGILLLLAYLGFFAWATHGPLNPLLIAAAAILLLVLGQKMTTSLERPVLVFLAALVISAIFSIDPRRSQDQVWILAAGFFFLIVVAESIGRGLKRQQVSEALLLVGGIAMALSWYDAGRWYGGWLKASAGEWLPSVGFRLNGSNNVAAYFNVILMLAAALLVFKRGLARRVGLGIYVLSALVLIFLTTSRGAWIGTGAGLATLAFLGFWHSQSAWVAVKQFVRHKWAIILVVAAPVAGALVIFYLYAFAHHPTHGSVLVSRSEFWPVAWRAFLQSPLWGKGPGIYASLYMQSFSTPPGEIFLHAHNMYMDVLGGSGLLGAVALLYLGIRTWQVFRSRLMQASTAEFALLAGAAAALVAYLVHGFFDGLYRMPFASFALLAALGAALSQVRSVGKPIRGEAVGLGILVAVFALFNLWRTTPYEQGVAAAGQNDPAQAVRWFKVAVQRDPGLAMAYQQLGLAESQLATPGTPAVLDDAIHAFEQAVRLDPYWAVNDANLGALYQARGNLKAAGLAFEQAARSAPKVADYQLYSGVVAELSGNDSAASAAYRQALALDPDLYPAYFWRSTPLRAKISAQFADSQTGPRVYDYTDPHDETILRVMLQNHEMRAINLVRLAEIERTGGHLTEAGRLLAMASYGFFDVNPLEHLELDWQQAEQAAANQDWQSAVAYAEKYLDEGNQQGAYGPGSYGELAYAHNVFGMSAMSPELVPQLAPTWHTDSWGNHMKELSGWYRQLGDQRQADLIQLKIKQAIPDW